MKLLISVLCFFTLATTAFSCPVEDRDLCEVFSQFDSNYDQKLNLQEAYDAYYELKFEADIIKRYSSFIGNEKIAIHIYTFFCKYQRLPDPHSFEDTANLMKWALNPRKKLSTTFSEFKNVYVTLKEINGEGN